MLTDKATMKQQLTINDLKHYLGTGLGFKHKNGLTKLTIETINYWFTNYYIDPKPLLIPLSHIAKEINHYGEKFIPLEKCCMDYTTEIDFIEDNKAIRQSMEHTHLADYSYEIQAIDTVDGNITIIEEFSKDEVFKTQLLNYDRFLQLCKWHFDVFNLIPKGLALNKLDYETR